MIPWSCQSCVRVCRPVWAECFARGVIAEFAGNRLRSFAPGRATRPQKYPSSRQSRMIATGRCDRRKRNGQDEIPRYPKVQDWLEAGRFSWGGWSAHGLSPITTTSMWATSPRIGRRESQFRPEAPVKASTHSKTGACLARVGIDIEGRGRTD